MTREEAIEILTRYKEESEEDYYVKRAKALTMAIEALEQEPREGHIEYNELEGCYECSECKNAISEYYSFCPNCGADIRAESEET